MSRKSKVLLIISILIAIGYTIIINDLTAKPKTLFSLLSDFNLSRSKRAKQEVNVQDMSLKKLVQAYQDNKNNYSVNIQLGYRYLTEKKYSNAKFHYKNALKLNPDSLEPRLGLYRVYMAQKKYSTAEKYSKSVVKIDNYNYYGNLYLMYSYMYNGKYHKASTIARKMLRIYPSDTAFQANLKYSNQKVWKNRRL